MWQNPQAKFRRFGVPPGRAHSSTSVKGKPDINRDNIGSQIESYPSMDSLRLLWRSLESPAEFYPEMIDC